MQRFEDTAQVAENEIVEYQMSRETYANLLRTEMDAEAKRHVILADIVTGLLGTTNPATGRPHSASSAEDAARVHPDYLTHLKNLSSTVHAKNRADTMANVSHFRAHLALAVLKATAGVA